MPKGKAGATLKPAPGKAARAAQGSTGSNKPVKTGPKKGGGRIPRSQLGPQKYQGRAGSRQYKIDKINALKGSKAQVAAGAVKDVTGQVTGAYTSQEVLESRNKSNSNAAYQAALDEWSSVINGTPEPAEGTGDGASGSADGTGNTTGSIPGA